MINLFLVLSLFQKIKFEKFLRVRTLNKENKEVRIALPTLIWFTKNLRVIKFIHQATESKLLCSLNSQTNKMIFLWLHRCFCFKSFFYTLLSLYFSWIKYSTTVFRFLDFSFKIMHFIAFDVRADTVFWCVSKIIVSNVATLISSSFSKDK